MDGEAWLYTTANLNELAAIRRFVEDTAADLQVDSNAVADMLLAVTEIVTNIIVHGYKGEPGTIEITISKPGKALIVRICDQAPSFDPTALPTPDRACPLEQRPLGGMGVFLTMDLMDEVRHHTPAQGGNELILIKQCAS